MQGQQGHPIPADNATYSLSGRTYLGGTRVNRRMPGCQSMASVTL
jgi:hypothetical protein